MKIVSVLAAAGVAAVVLSGCVSAPQEGARVGFYDGYYGAYYGGFWGEDGHFYYFPDASRVKVVRDDGDHFTMHAKHGYWQVQARGRVKRLERAARGEAHQAAAAPQMDSGAGSN